MNTIDDDLGGARAAGRMSGGTPGACAGAHRARRARTLRTVLVVALSASTALGVTLNSPSPAAAAPTFTVDSTADDHDARPGDGVCSSTVNGCTLRAAVEEAASAPGAVISAPAGTYALTLDQLDLAPSQDVTIVGAGSGRTRISGQGTHRVFDIAFGASVTIDGVSIQAGHVRRAGFASHWHGAGIHNHGTLRLQNSTLIGNTVAKDDKGGDWGGGAITNASSGTAKLVNVTLYANTTRSGEGAGIENLGRMTLENVTVGLAWANGSQAAVHNASGAELRAESSVFQHVDPSCGWPQQCVGAPNCRGTIIWYYSTADDASCRFGFPYDGVNARFGPFDWSAHVLPPTVGSPTIDGGAPTQHGGRDQLGHARPVDGDCLGAIIEDLGAVEYQPTYQVGTRVFQGCRPQTTVYVPEEPRSPRARTLGG